MNEQMVKKYFVILITFFTARSVAQELCTNPNEQEGVCVPIKSCKSLLDMLVNNRTNPEVVKFLRNSRCGGTGNDPMVCCIDNSTYPRLYSPPKCGHSQELDREKIQGGHPAAIGAWPWIAALGYRSEVNPLRSPIWLCGGSVITTRHVLTAAHCINPPKYKLVVVRIGELNFNRTDEGATPKDFQIEKMVQHPDYVSSQKAYDLAIIKLKGTITFSSSIQPICLPKSEGMKLQSFEGTNPFVAGWGSVFYKGPRSSQLLEVQLPVVSNEKCQEAFSSKDVEISSKQLCAGTPTGGKDSCEGDSGGPLMFPVSGKFYLIGIVSFGFKCAEPGIPGVYTRVTEYIDWIHNNIL